MQKAGIILVCLVVISALSGCVGEEKMGENGAKEIPIGLLVDLSGPLMTYGEDIKNAVTIASEDINSYFEENGRPYRVKVYVEDTKVDPKIALDKVMTLHGKGIKLIVGPMGSGEVKQIAEYVIANDIIIVSPSSTAAPELLGITKPEEKRYIFRFVALDTFQTKAIAKELDELGIKAVCIVNIGNGWGKGLKDYIIPELEGYGIEVKDTIEYPDPAPADFTPYIATLENDISDLTESYELSEIGVVVFSYEEAYTMLSQVKDDSILLDVRWIGCDGTAKSDKVMDVCDKADAVGFYSTVFESKGEAYDNLNETFYERYGKTPYQYGLNAYDATWVLALAYAELSESGREYSASEMSRTIKDVTEKYSKGEYGQETVSGYITLDEYNDRASGDYAIFKVENCTWKEVGIWRYETGEIRWK
ncbi:MAG TPA: ABC transporter substrate-binding protein [Candidatus Syntrophoarchaeum butanivorans]|uniref:ABC transporter substrate-binding protein n=2 Tax=Candidatus Syntropharchaeum butanivorans TaxID=1839936 RepID=A0A7J2S2H3_9EURY|nr:ABC transporter substrate-binding protein [Candidatus Syntrophoarchaeum butanivorans]